MGRVYHPTHIPEGFDGPRSVLGARVENTSQEVFPQVRDYRGWKTVSQREGEIGTLEIHSRKVDFCV